MPHGRNQRFAAGCGGAGDALAVEDPQILLAAAAACDQDQVRAGVVVQCADARHNAALGLQPLHVDGCQQQLHAGPAAGNDVLHILPCRAGLAGDHADASWHGGQRALAFGRKKPLGFQFFVQRVKRHLCRTCAEGAHIVGIQLKAAVTLIDGGVAVDQHLHPVLRFKRQKPRLTAEHYRLDPCIFVLEGKVDMPAFVVADKAGDLAADDDIVQRVALRQHLFCQAVEVGYLYKVGHAPHSLAASTAMPMALSLANFAGTKRASGRRAVI